MSEKAAKVCQEDGCGKPVQAKGRCNTHYQAWRRSKLARGKKGERTTRQRQTVLNRWAMDEALNGRFRRVLAERLR